MKTRSDSWLAPLTEEQRHQAFLMLQKLGYESGRFLIAKEFGIRVPSMASISNAYSTLAQEYQRHELAKALVERDNITTAAAALGDVNKAVASALGQLALDAAVTKDPERVSKLVQSLCTMMQAMNSKERLHLDLDKFQFDAAKAALAALDDLRAIAADSTLDATAQVDAVRRRLFGEVPA